MRYIHYFAAGILSVGLWGCTASKKTATPSEGVTKGGIRYKLVHDAKGNKIAKEGDYVELHIKTYFEDSLIFNSREQTGGKPVSFPAGTPRFNGDLTEAFYVMTPGDSGIFNVSVDSLRANKQNLQPWMEEGKYITYSIKLEDIKTREEINAEKEKVAAQKGNPEKEDQALQKYFKKKGISPKKQKSGLYYLITKATDGEKPISGRSVKVNYTGKLMDGTVFDSNTGKDPYKFVLGRGQVILGWDEGIALLKKGEKATLFIPSHLAYGDQSPTAKIPPGSTLVFDVELVDF